MNKHRGHAEGSGDGARVLSGSAKRGEDVRRQSNPLLSVIWRMGRHMASLATLTYPSATSSTLITWSVPVRPSSRLIFWASASNADRVDAASRGSSSSAPKILGKYSGRTLPSSRLASVTARFAPPFL